MDTEFDQRSLQTLKANHSAKGPTDPMKLASSELWSVYYTSIHVWVPLDHTAFLTHDDAGLLETTDLLLQVRPLDQQSQHWYEVGGAGLVETH